MVDRHWLTLPGFVMLGPVMIAPSLSVTWPSFSLSGGGAVLGERQSFWIGVGSEPCQGMTIRESTTYTVPWW